MSKTKQGICIDCGKEIIVSAFASLKKCKCDECKGGSKSRVDGDGTGQVMTPTSTDIVESSDPVEVQQNNGNMTVASLERPFIKDKKKPRIDGVPNKALQSLCCPHHPSQVMVITSLIRSDMWGDTVGFQCPICNTMVQISDSTFPSRIRYTHKGELEVDEVVESVLDGLKNGNVAEKMEKVDELKWTNKY